MLFLSSRPGEWIYQASDKDIQVTDGEINSLLREKLAIEAVGYTNLIDISLQDMRVYFTSDSIVVLEKVQWFNRPLVIRYVIFYKVSATETFFGQTKVFLGSFELPNFLASKCYHSFIKKIAFLTEQTGMTEFFALHSIEAGAIKMMMIKMPPLYSPEQTIERVAQQAQLAKSTEESAEKPVEKSETTSENTSEADSQSEP
jgi:hypothetical protein